MNRVEREIEEILAEKGFPDSDNQDGAHQAVKSWIEDFRGDCVPTITIPSSSLEPIMKPQTFPKPSERLTELQKRGIGVGAVLGFLGGVLAGASTLQFINSDLSYSLVVAGSITMWGVMTGMIGGERFAYFVSRRKK